MELYHLPSESVQSGFENPNLCTTLYNKKTGAVGFKLDKVGFTNQEVQGKTLLFYAIILFSGFHQFLDSHQHQITGRENSISICSQSMPSFRYNTPWLEFRQMSDCSFENNWLNFIPLFLYIYNNFLFV